MACAIKSAVLFSATFMFLSATTQPMWAAETEWLNIDAEEISDYEYKGERIIISDILLREVPSLPIRLTPMTTTCRVPPLSRVKLGIGWSRGVARDAEQ